MTHDRTRAITDQFEAWLDGLNPPASMRENPERMQKEKLSLLKIVLRFSPADAWAAFIDEALDNCAMLMKARVWPTQNELGAAFRNHRKESPRAFGGGFGTPAHNSDPASIVAARMDRGEAVGEDWLYGISACEMIARGLVDRQTMEAYRSGAFFARKTFYGEENARAWEDQAKSKHETAKDMWRNRNAPRRGREMGDLRKLVCEGASDYVSF
jgi:hypothetical protein